MFEKFKAWRKRRYWAARHLEFIRTRVLEDQRWLSTGDPVAEAIMERYQWITSPNFWYSHDHEPIDQFRRRIGLCPWAKREVAKAEGESS